jgi:hypothetical protein
MKEATMKHLRSTSGLALLAVVVLGACSKEAPPPPAPAPRAAPVTLAPTPAPFRVTSADLGKSIGDDKRIKDAATTFGPHDTIYVAVSSEGASPKATLKARWTFGTKGTLVNEETRDIAPTGPAVTEFHISKPSGWPVGKYTLEVSVDGSPVATKEVLVQK